MNTVIILAAGKSTRFKSSKPKIMHSLANQPIYKYLINIAKELQTKQIIFVTSEEMHELRNAIDTEFTKICHITQKEQNGTGDAAKSCLPAIEAKSENVIILYGDHPLIKTETINKMIESIETQNNSVVVIGFKSKYENQYAKLQTNKNKLERIIEHKNATLSEKSLELCNSGILAIKRKYIDQLINTIKINEVSKEFYLTDIVEIANNMGLECSYIEAEEEEVLGINTRAELAIAEKILQNRICHSLLNQGVTIINPDFITFSYDTVIGKDCVIHPYVYFGPGVIIENNVEIKSFSHIEQANIKDDCIIGPYARIRPGSIIESKAKIGNFVEIKNSRIGKETKINHLTYIGDADIGSNTNVGAGTITCNYDGIALKHKTFIGNNVSVGSNNTLVAPIKIGDGAITAAGSTLTQDIEDNSLSIARADQKNIIGKAGLIRNKKLKIKKEKKNE
jgi:bifunctional UDP-N-acetylglucosamine pyrophosphorylase / glucosamine-1-phosphate N-acetyltransferase